MVKTPVELHIISDATGETATRLVMALEAQFPLGMFETSEYAPQRFRLRVGDRLFVVSDGVFDAPGGAGRYGDAALYLHRVELQPPGLRYPAFNQA